MKTQDEIVKRIKERKANDFLGFEIPIYMLALDFEHAKQILKPDVTEWEQLLTDDASVINEIKNYIPFAEDKIEDLRGISASRSILHFIAWTWLIDEAFSNELQKDFDTNYKNYGKAIVAKIRAKYIGD